MKTAYFLSIAMLALLLTLSGCDLFEGGGNNGGTSYPGYDVVLDGNIGSDRIRLQ